MTLTNEGTNVSRDTATNDVGRYTFGSHPGTYTLKVQIQGYKRYESKGLNVGTQQFVTLDMPSRSAGSRNDHGDRPGAADRHVDGIDRRRARSAGARNAAGPGRNAFLIGVTVPTVMPAGDPQFNRQQDQTNASRVSIGGGGLRANNYLLDGVPITELRGRAVLNPTIEAVEEVKVQVHTYDAEMGRTGGGVFNVNSASGTNAFHGSGFYQTRPVWGAVAELLQRGRRPDKGRDRPGRHVLPAVRRRRRRADQEGPDVLLGGDRRLPIRHDAKRAGNLADPEPAERRFFATTSGGAPAVFQPVLPQRRRERAVPGNRYRIHRDWWIVHRRHHPADAPGGQPDRPQHPEGWPTQTIQGPMAANEDGNPNASGTAFIVDKATCSRSRPSTNSATTRR